VCDVCACVHVFMFEVFACVRCVCDVCACERCAHV